MEQDAEARRLAIETLSEAPPDVLFVTPIDYIFADHFRHRTLCRVLDGIAEAPGADRDAAAAALRFLTADFSRHVADEEEDLFPLLRQRAAPEDCADDVLDQLTAEHAQGHTAVEAIVRGLSALLGWGGDQMADAELRRRLTTFARHERHHLTLENAIVLPLARARLDAADLRDLGARMARRRGFDLSALGGKRQ